MQRILVILTIVLPLGMLGQFIYGRFLSPSLAMMLLTALLTIGAIAAGKYGLLKRNENWLGKFWWYLAATLFSLLLSPYFVQSIEKGLVQAAGMVAAACVAFAIYRETTGDQTFLMRLVKVSCITCGIVAGIGVLQFLDFNLLGNTRLFDFEFMNEVAGGTVWFYPGEIGGWARANSIMQEPALFTRYLGMAAGFAVIRLGIAGPVLANAIARVMPLWAAISCITGFLVSISILGSLNIFIVSMVCLILPLSRQRKINAIIVITVLPLATLAGLFIIATVAESEFLDKVLTIESLFGRFGAGAGSTVLTEQISAFAIRINVEVAIANLLANPLLGVGLGAHGPSYAVNAPEVTVLVLDGLNSDDAASLLLRVLSESGLIGATFYLMFAIGIFNRARKAIYDYISAPTTAASIHYRQLKIALAISISAGWAGILSVSLMRTGFYFDAAFWIMVGLTAAVPKILSNDYE
jgi:hypothetical protein